MSQEPFSVGGAHGAFIVLRHAIDQRADRANLLLIARSALTLAEKALSAYDDLVANAPAPRYGDSDQPPYESKTGDSP